ncbi:hypothetical protein RM533_11875 [Croceicoccus sp. F390]|uniref:PhnA-like protein n=1 Tax=Croceicoccus esteveae TaxID=3075597 RepID=A0ABU2ZKH0_9SPHN|nr:hypothetical protein [Croceicoccus sp. F390]MDT0576870.1 hypothetical protein [Croceicoccus sp. F390]
MVDNRVNETTGGTAIPVQETVVHDHHVQHNTVQRDRGEYGLSEDLPGYVGDAFRSRVSWGAIFAGTVVGVAVLLLLALAGMALGLSSMDFGPGESGFSGIPTGAGIWLVVSQLIALAIGGFVAGRLAAIPKSTSTAFHGAAVWGLATLLTAYMASSAVGSIVNSATSLIGSVSSGIAQVAPAAVPDQQTQDQIAAQTEQAVNSVLSQREQQQVANAVEQNARAVATGDATIAEAARNVTNRLFGANGVVGPEDRQQAIDQLAQSTGMSQAEATQIVNNVEAQAQQVANNAPAAVANAATEATDAIATAAFWAFIASLLGLAAAVFGAISGRTEEREVVRRL